MDQIKSNLENADPLGSWFPFIVAGIVFLVTVIRAYMGGQMCPARNNIQNLIVIVTGASDGIGLEIVKDLCSRGAHIIMACRDEEKTENVKKLILKKQSNAKLEFRYLDLKSFDCVKRFIKNIDKDFNKIDILINNAGIIFHPEEKTVDGFEIHLQVNYLSHFMLTHFLLEKLKKSDQGRIINVTAHAYEKGKMQIDDPLNIGTWSTVMHPRDAYAHSKLAVVLSTQYLAEKLKQTKITVNTCTPGFVRGTNHLRQ